MVKKSDWKILLEMPQQNEEFILEASLSNEDIELIKEGFLPKEMEDKWFMYYEDDKLFIHRSWTGYCIYIVDMSEMNKLKVIVNRNPEQYKETDIERDKIMVNIQLNSLLNKRGRNADLMRDYIKRFNN